MGPWASLLGALAKLVGLLLPFLRERQARKDGATENTAAAQKEVIREVQIAEEERDRVRADIAADPGSLRDPGDEFARQD